MVEGYAHHVKRYAAVSPQTTYFPDLNALSQQGLECKGETKLVDDDFSFSVELVALCGEPAPTLEILPVLEVRFGSDYNSSCLLPNIGELGSPLVELLSNKLVVASVLKGYRFDVDDRLIIVKDDSR
jgi:hypothetical protein